jgi:DNA-binding NarL/FixJ family response regulator
LSGGKLEKCGEDVGGRKGGSGIAEAKGKLGMQPIAAGDGGCPAMNASARQSLVVPEQGQKRARSNGDRRGSAGSDENVARPKGEVCAGGKPRVFVAAENRLLREALSRMLVKSGNIEVAGVYRAGPFRTEDLMKEEADILLLTSRGSMNEDLSAIRKVRASAPNVQILLIGVTGEETEFLQCVRAGVSGYLPKSASAEDVVEGVRAVQAGEAVCPGTLCALLFHYFEREATSFPSASAHQRMGLTRREQQLIPLIAEGLTNKEIANRFCLSEQTVKNHLYRMKHKVGAGDRLGIVQVCRIQGFMV